MTGISCTPRETRGMQEGQTDSGIFIFPPRRLPLLVQSCITHRGEESSLLRSRLCPRLLSVLRRLRFSSGESAKPSQDPLRSPPASCRPGVFPAELSRSLRNVRSELNDSPAAYKAQRRDFNPEDGPRFLGDTDSGVTGREASLWGDMCWTRPPELTRAEGCGGLTRVPPWMCPIPLGWERITTHYCSQAHYCSFSCSGRGLGWAGRCPMLLPQCPTCARTAIGSAEPK